MKVMVNLKISRDTLAILISGLYCSYHDVDAYAIPRELWFELTDKVIDWFDDWDYDKLSFEDWIKYNILIFPKIAMSEKEVESCKDNDLYFEVESGNVILVVSVGMNK